MKYTPAYERYFDEEDKNKTLVHHYKNGEIATKGEPTHVDDVTEQSVFLTTVATVIPNVIPNAENIELAYIPISNEVIAKFNVGEEERCFVMKNIFNGFLLYSSVEIPVMDILTRVRDWHPEIEVYDDYPYTYYIPAALASWTKYMMNHSELQLVLNNPCMMIS